MTVVRVSRKYQVVIPKEVRERLKLRPGQEVEVFSIGGRVELVPLEPVQGLRGFLAGLPTQVEREEAEL